MTAALFGAVLTLAIAASAGGAFGKAASPVYRVDHVVDGDTIALRNGQRVRLVQIDTPEVFFGEECYGRAASRETKRLLSPGSRVRLFTEPATDRVDQYGRLLRYVVRIDGAVNVNIRLVAIGAAAPYFYRGVGASTQFDSRLLPRMRERGSGVSGERARTHATTLSRYPNAALELTHPASREGSPAEANGSRRRLREK